jgi:hypothetical protein
LSKRFWLYTLLIIVAGLVLGSAILFWIPQGSSLAFHMGIADPDLIWENAQAQASELSNMRAIGITSVRIDANWDMIQPIGPAKFKWTQLDQAVNSARHAGMSIDLIIDDCPPWAALASVRNDEWPQPASPTEYASFSADVARRYAPRGVNIFEIWNEPNIRLFWRPRPNPAAYTADLIAAYSAIKAAEPSAFVISGGLATTRTNGISYNTIDFLNAMYADGAKGSFDAVGDHPYSYPTLPNTYETSSGWSQMDQTKPSLRSVMARYGDSNKKIWITEYGAPSGGPLGIGQSRQASELTQAISYASKATWIGALYLFTWQDNGNDSDNSQEWFGLLTLQGVPKQAAARVKDAIRRAGL